ncbi:PfkB family carbohydrate kinase [Microbacterium sp. 13-71-7]|jgi:sugar/nucleoside kinase (ribokinase family)|uniref:carbohydrate kinase family protein n=1 Tax=Microbacterium sp. 13-71-7 TaxID=1970399 RepID=UPI000BCC12DC|nr:PfkB family carbohydrate kinase [Microbacterium sp. 13-71-7]OZB84757.1 MAG: carbohydrate kinase family protein [Microbacterium sp. 13-71-7]
MSEAPHEGRVAIVGAVSWNTIVLLDRLPEPTPHMQFAEADWQTVGGTSAGKALSLRGLGRAVSLRARVGRDAAGLRIRDALGRAGLPLAGLREATVSERHLNLMTDAGERVSLFLSSPEPAPGEEGLVGEEPPLAGAAAIVLDLSTEGLAAIEEAQATGVPIWVDLHDYDGVAAFHRPFLDAADVLFCNADRLPDPEGFLRGRIAAGAALAVCTLGAEGAIAVDRDGRLHRVAAVPVDVVDTNGAGDAFFAGVLDATLRGAAVDDALAAGAAAAATALRSRHLHPLLDDVLA